MSGSLRAAASQTDTKSIEARARVSSRTSLTVSSHVLQFSIDDLGQVPRVTVNFTAGVRTHAGAEVVLTVESLRAIEGPGGAADVEADVTFTGDGAGTLSGTLLGNRPVVAGRWSGGGSRSGSLAFALRASASGTYTLPVRFVLSAP